MVMTKVVDKVEIDKCDDYYIVFNFVGRLKRSLVTKNVLKYNHISSIDIGDEIFVSKVFNTKESPTYLIRKVIKNGAKKIKQ
jgi:hypothetical protein